MIVRCIVVGCLVLAGCKSKEPATSSAETAAARAAPGSAASAGSAAGSATGSAAAVVDPAVLDAIIRDVNEYTLKVTEIWVGDEVPCDEMAKRFLVLEPLATSVRTKWAEAVAKSSNADLAEQMIRERIKAEKPTMMPKIEARLADKGLALADLDKREAQLLARCGSHAELAEARDRVGLFKRTK